MKPRRGTPLFVRIFGLMLASVLAVQLISLALVLAAGPPPLPVYALNEVAATLRLGRDSSGQLTAMIGSPPPAGPADAVTLALAKRLRLTPDRVRVLSHHGPHGPDGFHNPTPARADLFVGRFEAARQLTDGRWVVVRPVRNELLMWRRDALIWLLAALAVVAPFALLLARRAARPVTLFAEAAERLGRDPHAPPLAETGPPEIAEAAAAFNEMQRRLGRHIEDRTLMIGAIAHDMRTPLTRLSLRLGNAPPELRDAARADVAEIEAMIAAAASFVRDAGRPIERRRLDLRSLVASVTDELEDAGEPVRLLDGPPVVIEGSPLALKALVSNLVRNALRYAGPTEVALRTEPGRAIVDVIDNGPGIADALLDRVFDPFVRGEQSRNRETGGFGLGLASVRGVARAHGGEVTLNNRSEGGLLARVELPRKAQPGRSTDDG